MWVAISLVTGEGRFYCRISYQRMQHLPQLFLLWSKLIFFRVEFTFSFRLIISLVLDEVSDTVLDALDVVDVFEVFERD